MVKVQNRDVPALTGLRGIAALWVIGFHCHTLLPSHPLADMPFGWGFAGVDIFFILSGFILASLNAGMTRRERFQFYLRRCFRIYPLHVAVMLVLGCIVLALALSGHGGTTSYYEPRNFIPVLELVQVPLGIGGWNDPAWSISVEMICYLTLPFVLPRLSAMDQRSGILVVGTLLAIDGGLLTAFGPRGRFEFVANVTGWFPIVRGALGFYAGCIASRLVTLERIGTMPILAPLAFRPIVFLGEISFSLYLLHQPILGFGKRLDPIFAQHGASVLLLPMLATVVCLLSCVTYRFIEQPARKLPGRLARKNLRKATTTAEDDKQPVTLAGSALLPRAVSTAMP